uniref:Gustatory receptor n=1 Tax=Stomoxys calcitrans TaxID=35570 RepID=A0A1I8NS68_STOCA
MADEMEIFLKILKYSGLMAVSVEESTKCVYIKNDGLFYLYHASLQLILLGTLVWLGLNNPSNLFGFYNDTSNYYSYITLQASFASQIFLRLWFISNQHSHLRILELCRKWKLEYLSGQPQTFHMYTKTRLGLLITVLFMYFLHLVGTFYQVGDAISNGELLLYFTLTGHCCVMTTVILYIYTALVITISNILKWISVSCEQLLVNRIDTALSHWHCEHLQQLMHLYDKISYITCEDVNSVYGISILVCTTLAVMETIWDMFILAISNSGTSRLLDLEILLWMLPMCTILIIGLLYNNVTGEARNTAKFLAKSCRSNDGMDKMIDKFLLKNLRQKPILTAYGFFSLDKSTLFKLFTTVFTYMVVLVQFKEMESTTKQLEKGS